MSDPLKKIECVLTVIFTHGFLSNGAGQRNNEQVLIAAKDMAKKVIEEYKTELEEIEPV